MKKLPKYENPPKAPKLKDNKVYFSTSTYVDMELKESAIYEIEHIDSNKVRLTKIDEK